MSKLDDDAQELIKLTGMESLLTRSRDSFADRLDDADVIRVVERGAWMMGGRTRPALRCTCRA